MRRFTQLFVLLSLFLTGCIIINLPRPEPLTEKVIGGKGADKVLVMDISGVISAEERGGALSLREKPNLIALIREQLDLASEDRNIRSVILRINSPGGDVTACDIINHEISNFRKKRKNTPIIAELMDVAASGGYYVAVASDKIVAHPTTVTGSIGVISYNINASGLMDKIGISDQTIKSGDKKDIGTPLRHMTEDERMILQSVIDSMYERFLDVIVEGRKDLASLDRSELKKIADGRIYTAEQALRLKLIDKVGYLDDAIAMAKESAGIKEATIVTYAPESSYKNNIYSLAGYPSTINLVNIDAGTLAGRLGIRFMYMWMP